ncbi:MAG: hypothetical protein K2Z81_02040, partial [Cyanobacteria bacterium]|nr:hypothetical protein [Cyanobacteriota bacterium]
MDDLSIILMLGLGVSGGGFFMARDVLRMLRYYKMSQTREFVLLCDAHRFFEALDMAVVSPPPSLTHPLAGCHWKKRRMTQEAYEASVSLVWGSEKSGSTLEIRAKWMLLPREQQSSQSTVHLEFEVNDNPPRREAEQIAYQLGSVTETIVTRLNNQHARTTHGAQRNYVESMLDNLGSRSWGRASGDSPTGKDLDPLVSAARWPSAQDYNEGMQNPRTAFLDFDLCYGRTVVDKLGLPKAISGNFASVYRIRCHKIDFAVRCFLRPVKDREYRYKILSQYICSDDLSYTVDLQYLTEGIRIRDKQYPVLKMEWVEGVTLECYVQEKLSKRESLLPLLSKFRAMTQALYDAGIAHGDLQHGNIIVRNEEL